MTTLGISPAPWEFSDMVEDREGELIVLDANGVIISMFGDMESCGYAQIADSHLISAAPDLYDVVLALWNDGVSNELLHRARVALAKAEGKEVSRAEASPTGDDSSLA